MFGGMIHENILDALSLPFAPAIPPPSNRPAGVATLRQFDTTIASSEAIRQEGGPGVKKASLRNVWMAIELTADAHILIIKPPPSRK
jgi:hypothetical protein